MSVRDSEKRGKGKGEKGENDVDRLVCILFMVEAT